MKENIYTIPLTESLENAQMCPFCFLENKLERGEIEYALGPSMMEPDSRIKSNETGFCRIHLNMMLKENKRLPLALMLSTHLEHILDETGKVRTKPGGGLLKKTKQPDISSLKSCTNGCVICDKIKYDTERYIEVFHHLFRREKDFKDKVTRCGKLCARHGTALLENAAEDEAAFIINLLKSNLTAGISELKAFIDMFDYRNRTENADAHKDAVPNGAEIARGSLENL